MARALFNRRLLQNVDPNRTFCINRAITLYNS